MTYKKFVENAIISDCEKNARKLLGEKAFVSDSGLVSLDMKQMTYKVRIEVSHWDDPFYVHHTYFFGGAFDEYAKLYCSVIYTENGEIAYTFNPEARKAMGLPDTIEL